MRALPFQLLRTSARCITLTAAGIACAKPIDPVVAEHQARSEIVAQVNRAVEATRTHNIDVYLDQLPDDILLHDNIGKVVTRDTLRAQVLRAWATVKETRALNVVVDSIVMRGDSATITTMLRWDRLVQQPGAKKVDTVVTLTRQQEFWKRTPKGWRAYSVSPLGGSTMVNGHAVVNP